MANCVDPDQTAPIGAVCFGATLFASIINFSVMLGNYLQQTTSAGDIFRCIFCLGGALRIKIVNTFRVLIYSIFGLFYSNFLIFTLTFSKVPVVKYAKALIFSGRQQFYSYFQNPSKSSDFCTLCFSRKCGL